MFGICIAFVELWCTRKAAKHERSVSVALGDRWVRLYHFECLANLPKGIHKSVVARCTRTISFVTLTFNIYWNSSQLGRFPRELKTNCIVWMKQSWKSGATFPANCELLNSWREPLITRTVDCNGSTAEEAVDTQQVLGTESALNSI